MTEKNAVLTGRTVVLPQKKVVEIAKPAPKQHVKQTISAPREKRMKHADDRSAQVASNQQMMAELQFVKKQLREAQEKLAEIKRNAKVLVDQLKAADPGHTSGVFSTEALDKVAGAL